MKSIQEKLCRMEKIRSVGVALAMQGSCISNVDVGSATIKLGEDGVYNMSIAAADMGNRV